VQLNRWCRNTITKWSDTVLSAAGQAVTARRGGLSPQRPQGLALANQTFPAHETLRERNPGHSWPGGSQSDIDSLRLYAGIHRRVFGYFRLLSRRFPYAVYYQLSEGTVEIWRVLDCRRDPQWIRQKLKPRPARRS
jgi:hypothetical protein